MQKNLKILLFIFLLGFYCSIAQKETHQWYFGNYAGLNFNNNPPAVQTGSMSNSGSCSSISDANGMLLLYSDGETVWNKNHQVMANGSGLSGDPGQYSSSLILKQPGSQIIYYVFTHNGVGPNFYDYSVVDLNLAGGQGSVTAKNSSLWSYTTSAAWHLAATKHCNQTDYWVMCHDRTPTFHAYALTAAGVNTTPVISVQGATVGGVGDMKFSPNGKKIALVTNASISGGLISVHDFDNSTGVVSSNSIVLTGINKSPYNVPLI